MSDGVGGAVAETEGDADPVGDRLGVSDADEDWLGDTVDDKDGTGGFRAYTGALEQTI